MKTKILLLISSLLFSVNGFSQFNIIDGVLRSYGGPGGDIVIPSSVEVISDYVFQSNTTITSVYIPTSVKQIGTQSFAHCENLTSITISGSVNTIGYRAFWNCQKLNTATISSGVTKIGNSMFESCINLETINLPNTLTNIGSMAFASCSKLGAINIPASVVNIGEGAFSFSPVSVIVAPENTSYCVVDDILYNIDKTELINYSVSKTADIFTIPESIKKIAGYAFAGSKLSSIDIQAPITSIEKYTFSYSNKLESINLPETVQSIKDYAFSDCKSLKNIKIPNPVSSIGTNAFSNCIKLRYFNFPNSLTTIGAGAFAKCRSLQSLEIPSSVIYIYTAAFQECDSLTSVIFPESITRIDGNLFLKCKFLESVYIPASVKTIQEGAFYQCYNLREVTVNWTTPYKYSNYFYPIFSHTDTSAYRLIVPPGTTEAYSADENWGRFREIEEYNTYEVTDNTLIRYNGSESDVVIPDNITEIGEHAFMGNTSIISVTIPVTVTNIGDYAFYGCSGLTSILAEDVVRIRTGNSISTTSVIPASVEAIGISAFEGCNTIEEIEIPSTVSSIGNRAFAYCTSLNRIKVEWEAPLTLLPEADVFLGVDAYTCELEVPSSSLSLYKTADVWSDFYRSITHIPNEADTQIKILNNSLYGYITISNIEGYNLTIVNMSGVVMYTKPNASSYENIPVSTWSRGTYIYKIYSDKEYISGKLLIQ